MKQWLGAKTGPGATPAAQEDAWKYGRGLRNRRRDAGITAVAMATKLGIHRNTLDRWESGQSMPTVYEDKLIRSALETLSGENEKKLDTRYAQPAALP